MQHEAHNPSSSNTPRSSRAGRVAALLLTFSLFLITGTPAFAQDILPLCGFSFEETIDYCSLFGLVRDWETCKCVPLTVEPDVVGLCDFTPSAAEEARVRTARSLFLAAAGLSFLLSIYLWFEIDREQGMFVGLWVPSILSLGAMVLPRPGGSR